MARSRIIAGPIPVYLNETGSRADILASSVFVSETPDPLRQFIPPRVSPLNEYMGLPTPLNLLATTLALTIPFSMVRRFDHEPDKYWQGKPIATLQQSFPTAPNPFSKLWRYDYVEPSYWEGQSIEAATLQGLLFPKMFGAGGQAPTKQWRYDYHTPEPVYYSPNGFLAPDGSAALNLLTAQKMFGAGGQVPSKLWRYDYNSGESYWVGDPTPAFTLTMLTLPKIYGQGGQAPTKQWHYDYLVEYPQWQGTPSPSDTLMMLTLPKIFGAGGQAPTKMWRYDYDSGQTFWQGAPIATNIEFFPFVLPFFNEWANQIPSQEFYWNASPSRAATLTMPSGNPFPNTWFIQSSYDSDVRIWSRGTPSSNTLNILTFGGTPFSKLWRYDYEPDKYWQGAPQPTNILNFPFVVPFSKQWRYDYDSDVRLWLGAPTPADTLVILVAGGKPVFKQWRYDYVPETLWQGTPTFNEVPEELAEPFFNEWYIQGTYDSDTKLWVWQGPPSNTLDMLVRGGKPFLNEWNVQYTWNTEYPQWQGAPLIAKALYVSPIKPPFNTWYTQYLYNSGETFWYWQGTEANVLQDFVSGGKPFFKQWRYDWNTELPQWEGQSIEAATLQGLLFPTVFGAMGQAPTKLWRYDYNSGETYWQGSPVPTNLRFFPFVTPFNNEWSVQYSYDSDVRLWVWRAPPSNTLAELVEGGKPFLNEWNIQYTYNSGETQWNWQGTDANTLISLAHTPFSKQWRYDFEPDKLWQGSPIPTNVRTLPFIEPFSNEWSSQYTYNQEFYWLGRPISTNINTLPKLAPFHQQWRYDHDSGQTQWTGTPNSSVALIILAQPKMFGAGGQSPTKQWHYDADFSTYWQGAPRALSPVFVTRFFGAPFQAPQAQWHFNMNQEFYWKANIQVNENLLRKIPIVPPIPPTTPYRDDLLWTPTRQINIALLTSVRPKPAVATYKWEYPSIDTIWTGAPTGLFPAYIRVGVAAVDPDNLLPSTPLDKGRKDALRLWIPEYVRRRLRPR